MGPRGRPLQPRRRSTDERAMRAAGWGPEGREAASKVPKATGLDLSQLTLSELKQLAERVAQEITSRQESGRRWLLENRRELVERRGPMYRNPLNSAETWSGKGTPPPWVDRMLARGYTLENLQADRDLADVNLPARARRGQKDGAS